MLEQAGTVTWEKIAAQMGISARALFKLRRRWPDLEQWVSDQLAGDVRGKVNPVLLRMAHFGLRGSEPHAATFLKYATAGTPYGAAAAATGGAAAGGATFNGPVFIAVPRPGDPVPADVQAVVTR